MSPPAPSSASASLAEILGNSALVWRGTESPHPKTMSTGFALDSVVWVDADRDEDARWAATQLVRDGNAGAVLVWTSTQDERLLRRLQLAAETGKALAFLYRSPACLRQPSPASLRVTLYPDADGTRAELIKVRGGHPRSVTLNL